VSKILVSGATCTQASPSALTAASLRTLVASRAVKRTRTPSPWTVAERSEMTGGVWSTVKEAVRQTLARAAFRGWPGASEAVASRR